MKNEKSSIPKVIIADDNVLFKTILETKLKELSFKVEFVSGGFHLLHLLEQYKDVSLVIMHENMFDMSAIEAISMIRINKSRSELPIIYISSKTNEVDIQEIIFAGANDFILEPTTFMIVIKKVKKIITK